MSGSEAWSIIAPMIYLPQWEKGKPKPEQFDVMSKAYVTAFIGLQLYDNWVAQGQPEEWREGKKK